MRQQWDLVDAIIARSRFQVHFQPIVRLSDRSVHRHEALLRLGSNDHILPSTQEFIAMVEGFGLTERLDLAVLARVLELQKHDPSKLIMVNVSGRSLISKPFREALIERLEHRPRLVLEVTETAQITDFDTAAETLERARSLGVGVCLDDFGTGYSSFQYLQELPVDCIKIDGRYTCAALDSPWERDVVRQICAAARAMGIKTIAEKVETEEHAALMTDLGVIFGQGWLFGGIQASPVTVMPTA